jgi:four helix bundle protein
MITTLEEFRTYNHSMEIAEEVWDLVSKWKWFEKDTVGKQLVKAVDSIGANLSEGLGRYHYRETINFAYYSRGSLFETKTRLTKSRQRKLIPEEQYSALITKLDILGRMINTYIRSIGDVEEPYVEYPLDESTTANVESQVLNIQHPTPNTHT